MISYSSSLCACSTHYWSFELVLFDLGTRTNHEPPELTLSLHRVCVNSVLRAISIGLCLKIIFRLKTKFSLFFHVTYSLNVAAVVRFKQRLALSDGADALETIKSLSCSPPRSVTTQQSQNTKTKGATLVEVGPIPHSSKCLSPESAGICCVPTDPTRRETREQKKVTERGRPPFKLSLPAPPRVKDGFLEKCLHGCIAWLQLLPSIKHMGLIYPCGP